MTTPPAAEFLDGWKLNKHGLERDTQRSRLYQAENEVFPDIHTTEDFKSTQAVHEYLRLVMYGRHLATWFPYLTTEELTTLHEGFNVHFKKRGKISYGEIPRHTRDWPGIILVKNHRNVWVILHELAHNVTPSPHSWHGSLFCHNYLLLVWELLGAVAGVKLEGAFIKNKVRYTT